MATPNHGMYEDLLSRLEERSRVSRGVLASVMRRVLISAPNHTTRADIAKGSMLVNPSPLNQSAVSKAAAALIEEGLLAEEPSRPDEQRAGRPIKPIRLGDSQWALMGVKITHSADAWPIRLTGVLTTLCPDMGCDILARRDVDLPDGTNFGEVARYIKELHDDLLAELPFPAKLFGLGIEVASHVHEGRVISGTHVRVPSGTTVDILTPLREMLDVPVVIDNDVNVLAVRETYLPQFVDPNTAVVAVFNDGVGGSLIIDGHVYRGGGGMAAEPGHQTVGPFDYADRREGAEQEGFSGPCHCGKSRHVDCYAVPNRLITQAGLNDLSEANQDLSYSVEENQIINSVFRIGGEALGQGIAGIINVVNPSRVLLFLPPELAKPSPGTAAAEYLTGVEEAVTEHSFSTGAHDARDEDGCLTINVLDPNRALEEGARCAAMRAFDAFIMHARGRDKCHSYAVVNTKKAAA